MNSKNLKKRSSIYLDYNATTPCHPFITSEIINFFSHDFYNPSAFYSLAAKVREKIDNARQNIAKYFKVKEKDIVFTSGGTESNNTVLKGVALHKKNKRKKVLISAIEHPSVYKSASWLKKIGFEVDLIPCTRYGTIDLNRFEQLVSDNVFLISVMAANNLTGVIQPLSELVQIADRFDIPVHTDAVAAIGKSEIDYQKTGVTFVTASSHKFYAPKGSGLIVQYRNANFWKLVSGGHQERDIRGGTENVPAIVGTGMAIEWLGKNQKNYNEKLEKLRLNFEKRLQENFSDLLILGRQSKRLSNTTYFYIPNVPSDYFLINLDLQGIMVSGGSACSTGKRRSSPIIKAMGYDDRVAANCIRVSLGHPVTESEMDRATEIIIETANALKGFHQRGGERFIV